MTLADPSILPPSIPRPTLADVLADRVGALGWQSRAACRPSVSALDDTAFLPAMREKGQPYRQWDPAAALAVCEACTVRQACADFAESEGIRYGVWGGRLLGRDPQQTRAHSLQVRRR